jgi:hypothetical protein
VNAQKKFMEILSRLKFGIIELLEQHVEIAAAEHGHNGLDFRRTIISAQSLLILIQHTTSSSRYFSGNPLTKSEHHVK